MADECSFCTKGRSTAIVRDDVILAYTDCKEMDLCPIRALLPASCTRSAWPAGPKITLLFSRLLVRASALITCAIITSRTLLPCSLTLVNLDSCFAQLLWVVYHSYNFEMDTAKQRQHSRDDTRLTESGNTRSEQLNTRGAYRVANQQSLACLSGSERRRPGWFIDMKYQTCFKEKPSFLDKPALKSNSPCLTTSTRQKSCSFSLWVHYFNKIALIGHAE